VDACHSLHGCGLADVAKEEEQFLGESQSLFQFHSVSLLGLLSIIQEVKLIIFINNCLNNRARSLHELLKFQSLILLLLLYLLSRLSRLGRLVI
jgi:ABC-type siderophore export system fused ATPase/permease subunit